jgi:DNA-binding response OmpR family regulator
MNEMKVLIVDDEEELVSTLLERLEMRGIPAEGTTDGHEALRRLAAGGYDVVVLDLMIPGLSGNEILREIRSRHPSLRVLLITGHGAEPGQEVPLPEGARDILLKPFRIETLIQRIQDCRRGEGC